MTVVTPEAVELDLRPIGVVARTLAKAIDVAIQLAAFLVMLFIGTAGLSATGTDWVVIVFWTIAGFAVVVGYPLVMETATRGRTVGKIALGLRTVTTDGLPIRFRHAAIRAVAELVDLWATTGAVGMSTIVWSRRHQRVGDMIAGTMVLRQRALGRGPGVSRAREIAAAPTRFHVPPGMERLAAVIDVARLDEGLYELIRSYLLRWRDIDGAARSSVGTALANKVAAALSFPPDPGITPDLFLATVAAGYQARFAAATPGAPVPPPPAWNAVPSPGWKAVPTAEAAPDGGGIPSPRTAPDGGGFTPIA